MIVKNINWECGGRIFNEADNIRLVDGICLCDVHVVDGDIRVHSATNVWFKMDELPFELTQAEIDEIQNPSEVENEEIQ